MSVPALPANLMPALTGRDAVADALSRAPNGTVMEGYDAIYTQCYANISKMDTNHFLSNMRTNILDGDTKAQVTCSAFSQHYRGGEGINPGSEFLLAGRLYWVELNKDSEDGLWKIKHWMMKAT